jgi:lysozyme family protein
MPVDIAALTAENALRWARMQIHPNVIPQIDRVVGRLWNAQTTPRYDAIAASTGIPAVFIALAHECESSGSWTASLAQGDPLSHRSVHVPAGRVTPPAQPPFTFEVAAVDALIACDHVNQWKDWSIGGLLAKLELWSGAGYVLHGHPSPAGG